MSAPLTWTAEWPHTGGLGRMTGEGRPSHQFLEQVLHVGGSLIFRRGDCVRVISNINQPDLNAVLEAEQALDLMGGEQRKAA